MRYAAHGENKSPAFEFHWNRGTNPSTAPEDLKSYTVILHDVKNSTNKTTTDTLHWDGVQHTWHGQRFAGRARVRRPARRDTERSGHRGPQRKAAGLFRAWRRTGADSPLRVRVLRAGYEAGSAGQCDAR